MTWEEGGQSSSGSSSSCDCASCPKLPGFAAAYFKIDDSVNSVEAIPSTGPLFTGSCLDIEFDEKAFKGVAPDFPNDHFAARWRGEMQVIEPGTYTFFDRSESTPLPVCQTMR